MLLLAGAWFYARGAGFSLLASSDALAGSGSITVDEYTVASDTAGRVTELDAAEGDTVRAGQTLAKLDAVLLTAQVEQADAAVAAAQANLAKLQAGPRAEEIAQAQAALDQAVAKRNGAKVALDDARALRSAPQDLDARIDAARAASQAAEFRTRAVSLMAQAATLERSYFQRTLADVENGLAIEIPTPRGVFTKTINVRTEDLRTQLALAASKEWSAWVAVSTASAQQAGAAADLQKLMQMKDAPLTLDAQVNAAQAQLDTAEAAVAGAQAKLDQLKSGTRPESIAAARAQVQQAQAARDALRAQLNKMTLTAPHDGVVTQRFLDLGEMAAAGSPVFHISDLDTATLTIYIPEDRIGRVQLGAPARVTVDSFPGRTFTGTVTFISPQAEFTPKNVTTPDQRSTQVFAVKVQVDNSSDHALKPGMPADAVVEGK